MPRNVPSYRQRKGYYTNVYFNKLLNIPPGVDSSNDLSNEPAPF